MKNFRFLGIIALIAVMGLFTGCVTATSIGGTADPHGLFSGGSAAEVVSGGGASVIASYSVILNIVDSGYEAYAVAVKAAEAEGKKITTTTKWLVFLTKITAYAQ